MSYILDALKRADAERERGAVPGLHSRQMTTPAREAAPGTRSRLGLAVAAVLALGAIAAGLWVWHPFADDTRPAAMEPAVEPVVARPLLPAPLAQPAQTATPAPASTAAPQPAPAPSGGNDDASVSKPAPAAPAHAPQASPRPRLDPVAKAAKPSASTPAAVATVPLLSELPEDMRRQIPALTITGAVYSEHPGQRMLLVNGQVLTQGSLAAPEVSLEEIRARSSVFSFRGTRFRVAH